ncbi:uncharacterized protein LOC143839175 [Paroedura picta]|uniref:uncharacterized protein LOC143839175 n=1 Tax=Paroedura picta TaxID=143630 RepID=UPI0040578A9E
MKNGDSSQAAGFEQCSISKDPNKQSQVERCPGLKLPVQLLRSPRKKQAGSPLAPSLHPIPPHLSHSHEIPNTAQTEEARQLEKAGSEITLAPFFFSRAQKVINIQRVKRSFKAQQPLHLDAAPPPSLRPPVPEFRDKLFKGPVFTL